MRSVLSAAAHRYRCLLAVGPTRTQTDLVNNYHHVFWLGDLNYRLEVLLPACCCMNRFLLCIAQYGHALEKSGKNKEVFDEMVGLAKDRKSVV